MEPGVPSQNAGFARALGYDPSLIPSCPTRRRTPISATVQGSSFMAIDWEVEYNNRARVPEHPQIFAAWARDGAAYRDETSKQGRAEIGLKYGPSARQTIDLFRPRGGGDGPLALFIHGGYWRSLEP